MQPNAIQSNKVMRYVPPGPVIKSFFESDARKRLLLGPFGSGKSVGDCNEIFRRARWQMPDENGVRLTRWAVVRNTYGELKQTTVRTWRAWFGDQFGNFTQQAPMEHRLRFGLRDGSSVESDVIFLAMDDEADVKKFLSLDVTGVWFNEVREIRKTIVDAADGRIGRYPKTVRRDGKVVYGPSWYGIMADTNMPDDDHWISEAYRKPGHNGWKFFRQPGGVMKDGDAWLSNPEAENLENLPDGYYVNQLEGKSEDWISVYLGAEFGRIPEEGAYYTDELNKAERDGRICEIEHESGLPVHTFWDLGLDDYMAIWFGQCTAGQWRWIDYYENTGKALGHYAQVMREKAMPSGKRGELVEGREFWYGKDVWPHDGVNRVDGKGDKPERRCDIWKEITDRAPIILPRAGVGDGIEAVRKLIGTSRYDRRYCGDGLNHLRRYGREFDSVRNVFKPDPRHDAHSHCADAKRTAAMGRDKCTNDVWKGRDFAEFGQGMAVV